MRNRLSLALAAATALALGTNGEAFAQNTDGGSSGGGVIVNKPGAGYGTDFNISVLGGIGSYGNTFGIGIGGLFGIPIVRNGFIPSLNESFHLEFGLFNNIGFNSFGGDDLYISPVGGVRWDWHIFREFTAYAALRTGVALGFERASTTFYFDGLVGGFWRFSKPVAVRFELGGGVVGAGVSGGIAFWF